MKRYVWLFVLILILTACSGNPTPAAVSSPAATSVAETAIVSDPNVVIASAVIAPAQVSELGFTVSALVKDTLVMEGEQVLTGQPLIVLDTPELEFAVTAAEFDYKSKSLAAELQKAEKV
ncbi:MAG: biotin/lipoyl-binding protein, partial [Anaerolineales bacterium]|nr:biotin/lipoyl-binding protein [Anaerolineales bacterium]